MTDQSDNRPRKARNRGPRGQGQGDARGADARSGEGRFEPRGGSGARRGQAPGEARGRSGHGGRGAPGRRPGQGGGRARSGAERSPRELRESEPNEATARFVATTVLMRVCDEQAFASVTMDAELRRAGLASRDAGLCTEIVYGSLRVLPALDARLDHYLNKPLSELDGWVRACLRAGAYQLRHLGRVPTHAAVSETVRLAKLKRGQRLSGLANAVMRRLSEERPEHPEPPTAMVLPPWLERVLGESLGETRAQAFTRSRPLPPPLGLRVRKGEGEAYVQTLRGLLKGPTDAAPQDDSAGRDDTASHDTRVDKVRLGEVDPQCVLAVGLGDPRRFPGFEDGAFVVQEQGAQVVAALLEATAADRVLDACSGHGGKTLSVADQVGTPTRGQVTAVDVDERKLEKLERAWLQLGLPAEGLVTVPVDLSVGTGGLEEDGLFDRIMVDAPCSGLGTIHRRPELLLRVSEDDVTRLAELQAQILRNAARLVRPGGLLVFAVCSPTSAECAGVVHQFLAEAPPFDIDHSAVERLNLAPDADGVFRLGPWQGDLDGYQAVRLRRRA